MRDDVSSASRRVSCWVSSRRRRAISSDAVKGDPRPPSTHRTDSAPSSVNRSANTRASSGTSSIAPAVVYGLLATTDTSPPPPRTTERKPIDDRCPSPIWRTLSTTRSSPGASPLWSASTTALGLHTAAASTANSCVNVAPSSNRRFPESSTSGATRSSRRSAWRSNIAVRSRWRAANRTISSSSASSTSVSLSPRTWATVFDARPSRSPASACPGTNSWPITRDGSAVKRTGSRIARGVVVMPPAPSHVHAGAW